MNISKISIQTVSLSELPKHYLLKRVIKDINDGLLIKSVSHNSETKYIVLSDSRIYNLFTGTELKGKKLVNFKFSNENISVSRETLVNECFGNQKDSEEKEISQKTNKKETEKDERNPLDRIQIEDSDASVLPAIIQKDIQDSKLSFKVLRSGTVIKYICLSDGRVYSTCSGQYLSTNIKRNRIHIKLSTLNVDVFVHMLISKCFIPNSNGWKKVGYHDKTIEKFNSVENLYWIPENKIVVCEKKETEENKGTELKDEKESGTESVPDENEDQYIKPETKLQFRDVELSFLSSSLQELITKDKLKYKIISSTDRKGDLYIIFSNGKLYSLLSNKFIQMKNTNSHGYVHINMFLKKGKNYTLLIHRLVSFAFIPNPKNCKYMDHIDRNRTNNNVENLRWVNTDENNKNRKLYSSNKSEVPGVNMRPNGQFQAEIRIGPSHKTAIFKTKEEAIIQRKKWELEKEKFLQEHIVEDNKFKGKKCDKYNLQFEDLSMEQLNDEIKSLISNNNDEKEQLSLKCVKSKGKMSYIILSNGKILSLNTKKVLSEKVSKEEYERITLCIDGVKRTHLQINIIIATAFIPNPEKGCQVDHINKNKHDNRVSNLRWTTCSENNHNKGMDPKNTSGIKGVKFDKGKWCGYMTINGKLKSEYFQTKQEANKYRKELEGKYLK